MPVLNGIMTNGLSNNFGNEPLENSQLAESFDMVIKIYKKAIESVKQGDAHSSISRISEGLIALENLIVTSKAAIDSQTEFVRNMTLQRLISFVQKEYEARNKDVKIFVSGSTLISFPITASFSDGSKGISININGQIHKTLDPGRIAEVIETELKKPFKIETFGKNIIDAYDLLTRGRPGELVHLDEIRQLFSLSRDLSGKYSPEQFNADLQKFYHNGILQLHGRKIEITSNAASRNKFPIFINTDNSVSSVNASGIIITHERKTNPK